MARAFIPAAGQTCHRTGTNAFAQVDHATLFAQVRDYAYGTVVQEPDPSVYSEVTDWLIDSGCSISMTPFIENIVADKSKSDAVVGVATGVLTPAPLQGTVKIHIQDIYIYDGCFVFLHDVLYVPGLSRRLLSVRQWNTTGGDVVFELNHCVLSILDSESDLHFDMHVRPHYATEHEELHSPDANIALSRNLQRKEYHPTFFIKGWDTGLYQSS